MASENPEFGTTLVARRLNQSRASAVLQSNLIAILKLGTAEARRLSWDKDWIAICCLQKRTRVNVSDVITIKITGNTSDLLKYIWATATRRN